MAELPELRSSLAPRVPAPVPPPRQLYDRPHSYGVARELDLIKAGLGPRARPPRIPPRALRMRRGPWASFRRWAASRERGPADLWHGIQCRRGRHDMRGGHQMQLGSRWVYVERRCRWCDASPAL